MSKKHALKVNYDYEPKLTIGDEIIEYEKNYKLTLDDGHILIGKFQLEDNDIIFVSEFYKIYLTHYYLSKNIDDHIVAMERID